MANIVWIPYIGDLYFEELKNKNKKEEWKPNLPKYIFQRNTSKQVSKVF